MRALGFGTISGDSMRIMIRKDGAGVLTVYVPKKDLEEPIVSMEKENMWGGIVTLANGWQLELPPESAATVLPCTVEARKLNDE
jgi:nitrogen fixation protein NifT